MRLITRFLPFLVVFTLRTFSSLAQDSVLEQKLSLGQLHGTVGSFLDELRQKGHIVFSFSHQEVDLGREVTLSGVEQTVGDYLETLLGKAHFDFRTSGNKVILKKKESDGPGNMVTISGYITDSATGEALPAATLYEYQRRQGTAANRYGFYSFTLPAGEASLTVSYVGYHTDTLQLMLHSDTSLSVKLKPSLTQLGEVVVKGVVADDLAQQPAGTLSLPVPRLKAVPNLLGEADILKALALTPGVGTGNEGTAGLLVRGGTPDQNLILLDEATVYNVAHLFGLVSIFNADALKQVDLYKSGFPARFGGRLSSVVDITMKEGNNQKLQGEAGIGLVGSRFTLEGPLSRALRGRSSFMVSGRASYVGLLLLPNYIAFKGGHTPQYFNYWLYDTNAKVNHAFKDGGRLFLSFYKGNDIWRALDGSSGELSKFGLDWGNTTATARYTRPLNSKWFFRTVLTHTGYAHGIRSSSVYRNDGQETPGNHYNSHATLRDWTLKAGVDVYPNPAHQVKVGLEGTHHTYRPNRIETSYPVHPDTLRKANAPVYALETALYAEDNITITPRLHANLGLRGVAFGVNDRTYGSLEPRTSLTYSLPGHFAVKGAYSQMKQFIHLLVSSGVGLPNDVWVPATGQVPPQVSQQVALGLSKAIPRLNLEISLEGYYKTMHDVIDYQTGVNYLSYKQSWENQIEKGGRGRSYGLELFLNKTKGRFTGWASYTYAWNWRRFARINEGNWYAAPYDRRHSVALTGNYAFSPKFNLSANWVYHSGQPTTVPIALRQNPNGGYDWLIYGERNNYRMPAFHRLDVAANLIRQSRRGRQITWSLGLYNAYSRKNPYFLDIDRDPWMDTSTNPHTKLGIRYRLVQQSVFPLLPFVSYAVKF